MEIKNIIESLSPLERKILPFLNCKIEEIVKKSGLDKVSVIRAMRFLENKNIIIMKEEKKEIVDLGVNGIYYKKTGLPERKLITVLEHSRFLSFEEAKKTAKLSENEFRASLGALKGKLFIKISNGKISLAATKEEIVKKSLEESLLEILPVKKESLSKEQLFALKNLMNRKDIIEIRDEKDISFGITDLGKDVLILEINAGQFIELVEEVTSEIIRTGAKNIKFRRYDIK